VVTYSAVAKKEDSRVPDNTTVAISSPALENVPAVPQRSAIAVRSLPAAPVDAVPLPLWIASDELNSPPAALPSLPVEISASFAPTFSLPLSSFLSEIPDSPTAHAEATSSLPDKNPEKPTSKVFSIISNASPRIPYFSKSVPAQRQGLLRVESSKAEQSFSPSVTLSTKKSQSHHNKLKSPAPSAASISSQADKSFSPSVTPSTKKSQSHHNKLKSPAPSAASISSQASSPKIFFSRPVSPKKPPKLNASGRKEICFASDLLVGNEHDEDTLDLEARSERHESIIAQLLEESAKLRMTEQDTREEHEVLFRPGAKAVNISVKLAQSPHPMMRPQRR